MTQDWLLDDTRADAARRRLVDHAAALIRERGIDRFDLPSLAARAHCSRATIYRHIGGKAVIVEAVIAQSSERIVTAVRAGAAGLTGRDRAVAAFAVALREVRRDPVVRGLLTSRTALLRTPSAIASPVVTGFAADLAGLDARDTAAVAWAVRGFLALALWPMPDGHDDAAIAALVAGLPLADDRP